MFHELLVMNHETASVWAPRDDMILTSFSFHFRHHVVKPDWERLIPFGTLWRCTQLGIEKRNILFCNVSKVSQDESCRFCWGVFLSALLFGCHGVCTQYSDLLANTGLGRTYRSSTVPEWMWRPVVRFSSTMWAFRYSTSFRNLPMAINSNNKWGKKRDCCDCPVLFVSRYVRGNDTMHATH